MMTADMIRTATTQARSIHDLAPDGRRVLDLAEGVLIALRRCWPDAAFDELIAVAQRHGVSVSAVASALVALATDENRAAAPNPAAAHAADQQWGAALRQRSALPAQSCLVQ
ncbi:MAG: putative RNA-binding protein [Mycobacterium sp.]|nr:putative RNA-binding protein [Mycobacterium sp.]